MILREFYLYIPGIEIKILPTSLLIKKKVVEDIFND